MRYTAARTARVFVVNIGMSCGSCEQNRPYDVIQMAPDGPEPRELNLRIIRTRCPIGAAIQVSPAQFAEYL